ncbi:MAG: hypothetical protein EOO65_04590, partial [Methanosarcinales archaeon]
MHSHRRALHTFLPHLRCHGYAVQTIKWTRALAVPWDASQNAGFEPSKWTTLDDVFVNRDVEAVDAIDVYLSNHFKAGGIKTMQLALAQPSGTGKSSFARRLSWLLSRRRSPAAEQRIWDKHFRATMGPALNADKNSVWNAAFRKYDPGHPPGDINKMLSALQHAVVIDVECKAGPLTPATGEAGVDSSGAVASAAIHPAAEVHRLMAQRLGLDAGFVHDASGLENLMMSVCAACMSLPQPRAVLLIIDEFPHLLVQKQ